MAKFSKAQYELLTEAFGDALANVQRDHGSELMNANTLRVAGEVADKLKLDNENFNQRQFLEGIKDHAKLVRLTRDGINLQ